MVTWTVVPWSAGRLVHGRLDGQIAITRPTSAHTASSARRLRDRPRSDGSASAARGSIYRRKGAGGARTLLIRGYLPLQPDYLDQRQLPLHGELP
jgi:hypothetical protein